jgi:hypothetical protein
LGQQIYKEYLNHVYRQKILYIAKAVLQAKTVMFCMQDSRTSEIWAKRKGKQELRKQRIGFTAENFQNGYNQLFG